MVVRGKVMSVKGDVNDESGVAANFVVNKAWKTQVRKHVVVFSTTTCAYDLKPNAEYLLYVIALPGANEFSTKRCMGNLVVSDANDALDWLSRYGTEASVIDN
jgi:hypothetical protein